MDDDNFCGEPCCFGYIPKNVYLFTDEDLKRLKFNIENHAPNWVDKDNLSGLLARLEAAENFIGGRTVICTTCDNVIGETETDRALYKAWRKAAGK